MTGFGADGMLPSAAVAQITIRQGTPSEDANVLRVESWQTTSLAAALVLVIVVAVMVLRRWVRGGPEQSASAPRPAGGVLRLIDSPVRVMSWWGAGPQRIDWAILPVLVHAVASARVSLGLALPPDAPMAAALFSPLILAGASAAAVAAFGAHAVVVVVLDLLAAPSGRARRLVELSALAYWSQVAWSVPAALLVTGAGAVGDDLRVVLDATRQLWGVWLIGLHAAVLYVVTGLSVAGAVAAALIMLAVFYGLPPLVGMIGSQLLTPVP